MSEAFDAKALAQKLAGPDGVAAFDGRVREKRTSKFGAALSAWEAASLFDISRLELAIAESGIPLEQIDIFSRGRIVGMAGLVDKSGCTALDMAAGELRMGATLRVRDLQRVDSNVMAFVRGVQEIFAAAAQINLYLTPPQRDGFPPHFDITDVFIVQIAGSKAWRIYSDYADRKRLPTADTPWEPNRYRPIGAGEELTLHAGDVLYIPRGDMHSAACLAEESMHLTVSLTPMTYADMLAAALARVARKDERFRKRVPLRGRSTHDACVAAEAFALIDCLRAQIDLRTIVDCELQRIAAPLAPGGVFDRALHAQDSKKAE